jgi:Zn-dependent protease with chaperone function
MNKGLVASSFLVNFLLLNLFLSLLFFGVFLLLRRLRPPKSSRSQSNLLLYALGLPPLLAYITLIASLVPPFLIPEDHVFHFQLRISHPYHHLCFFHSPVSLPSSLIFRGLLICSVVLILFSAFRGLYACWRMRGRLGWLMRHRVIELGGKGLHPETRSLLQEFREAGGPGLHLIQAELPISFLSGIWRPHIILSTGLLQALSPGQVRALLQHEVAHRLRLDNLSQFLLSFCKNLLLFSPTGHLLFRWWRQEAELLCDEIAVYRTGRPLDLAEALLQMEKAMMNTGGSRMQPLLQSAFFSPAPSAFVERRIKNILRLCDQGLARPDPPCSRFGPLGHLVAFGMVFFLLLSLIDLWVDPLFLHCQLERIISFLV